MDGGTCVGASENNTSNARRAVYVLLPTSISRLRRRLSSVYRPYRVSMRRQPSNLRVCVQRDAALSMTCSAQIRRRLSACFDWGLRRSGSVTRPLLLVVLRPFCSSAYLVYHAPRFSGGGAGDTRAISPNSATFGAYPLDRPNLGNFDGSPSDLCLEGDCGSIDNDQME